MRSKSAEYYHLSTQIDSGICDMRFKSIFAESNLQWQMEHCALYCFIPFPWNVEQMSCPYRLRHLDSSCMSFWNTVQVCMTLTEMQKSRMGMSLVMYLCCKASTTNDEYSRISQPAYKYQEIIGISIPCLPSGLRRGGYPAYSTLLQRCHSH